MEDVVVLSAVRTPIGAFQGVFQRLAAPQLGSRAIEAAVEQAGTPVATVGQVHFGCVLSAGIGQAPARQAALGAGCTEATGAVTVNKVCGSGMRAIMMGANDLRCGDHDVVVCGGMESMTNAPYVLPKARAGLRMGHSQVVDSMVHDGLWDPYGDKHMGNCAELCADKYSFSREEQDEFAVESYERVRQATESGAFDAEIVPVEVPRADEAVRRDEDAFRVDLTRLAGLRSAFQSDGTVTAGNASSLSDGAAALVLTTAAHAEAQGLQPIARIVAQATFSQEPEWFTTAPVGAIRKVLDRAGLDVADIDLWEINEAFSVVVMAAAKELGLSHERVNVHGGAVAMGHPIGASGARIVSTLIHALGHHGKKFGCAAVCIGGGEATAVVVERLV